MTTRRGSLYAIGGAAVACAVAVVALAAASDHAAVPGGVLLLTVLASLSFVGSGLVALQRRPENRFGWLLVAGGYAFLGATLVEASWPPLFTFGLLVSAVYAPVLLHAVLAFPTGRLDDRLAKTAVVLAYLDLIPVTVAHVLLTEPDRWLDCECPRSLALVDDTQRAADVLEIVAIAVVGSAIIAAAVLVLARRWRHASAPLRRMLAPFLLVGGATDLVLIVGYTIQTTISLRLGNVIVWLGFVGLALLPLAFLAGLLRSRLARAAVAELVVELRGATTPADVRAALARTLGDPSLVLAYWLPDEQRYVSAEGLPFVLPTADASRGIRAVENEGERVAALVYDASLDEERELVDGVAAAGAMALENARLQAELKTHLAELRASRARIVEAGDAERRRIERNLHDGAQQRLVALSLSLGLVEKRLGDDPRSAGKLLAEAKAELAQGLDELRELARGIHPATLVQSGLAAAVEGLARRCPVPVDVDVRLDERPPQAVEVAAYFLISEALTNVAKYAQATAVTVAARRRGENVVVEVSDDGSGGADVGAGSGLRGLSDRVEGLGGRLHVWSPSGEGTRLRAELPCG